MKPFEPTDIPGEKRDRTKRSPLRWPKIWTFTRRTSYRLTPVLAVRRWYLPGMFRRFSLAAMNAKLFKTVEAVDD